MLDEINKEGNIGLVSLGYTNIFRKIGCSVVAFMPLVCLSNIIVLTKIGSLNIRPIDIWFVFGWIIWILFTFASKRISRKLLFFIVILSIFILIPLIGGIISLNYITDWAKVTRFIQTILWGGLAYTFFISDKDMERFGKNLIYASTILSGYSIYLFIKNPQLHRIAGFFSAAGGNGLDKQASYNEIGTIFAITLTLLILKLLIYKNQTRKKELFLVGIITVNMIGLILTQSRSALLAFILVFLYILYCSLFRFSKKYTNVLKPIIFSAGILAIGIIALQYTSINRILDTFTVGSNAYTSMTTRFGYWEKSIKLITESLFSFFWGHGNMAISNSNYFDNSVTTDSFYVDMLISNGIFGLIIVMLVMFTPLTTILKKNIDYSKKILLVVVTLITITVTLTGGVIVDQFYGGVTFIILYGELSILNHKKMFIKVD